MKNSITIILLIAAVFVSNIVLGDTALPPCPRDVGKRWDNCFGSYRGQNGDFYQGEWVANARNGHGTSTYQGEVYVGGFLNNARNGIGRLSTPGGVTYVGQFVNGNKQGIGKQVESNKTVYVGEWMYDRRMGRGVEYNSAGRVLRAGYWDLDLKRVEYVSQNDFPFSYDPDSSPPKTANQNLSPNISTESRRILELEKRIDELVSENTNLRSEIETLKAARDAKSLDKSRDIVKKCISQGLKPGTREFSGCIARQ